eukprot:4292100-Prymnesium_polylepis.1
MPGVTSGDLASEVSARTFPHGCITAATTTRMMSCVGCTTHPLHAVPGPDTLPTLPRVLSNELPRLSLDTCLSYIYLSRSASSSPDLHQFLLTWMSCVGCTPRYLALATDRTCVVTVLHSMSFASTR